MLLDVILVCYNQCQYIQQALESIFKQKVNSQVRIIIADDCSSDSTLDVIRSVINESPFEVLFLTTDKNLGISKNYYRAFNACSGDYIAVLEGDDYWCSTHHLQQHLDFMKNNPYCSMSMNAITFLEEETGKSSIPNWGYPSSPYFVDTKEQIENGNQLGNLSACVLRTSYVKKLPDELFNLSIADWMLGVMLSQLGPLGLLEESTSVYRMNSNSSWAAKKPLHQAITMYRLSKQYDKFQQGKYHESWASFRRRLLNNELHRLKRTLRRVFS